MQNLSFHGANENLYSVSNGNFFEVCRISSPFNPIMNEHLCTVKDQ